ncbi:hypothetical protein [Amycolatopsis sp. Poz14]|uniref:hypothetical protein n=1 Tax=Amycolatopsis sp. Poz14 TaxID=1447705 RepID=UPI001EE976DA|nr:hypothetical protein [Amycolatopsis sp. Poz14]MCG3754774.1 hypothetical protein [Amycolatopsis sp. Poz14]
MNSKNQPHDPIDIGEFDPSKFPRTWTHPRIGRLRRYPRINISSTEELMLKLGQQWHARQYSHEFSRYRLMRALATPCYLILIGYLTLLTSRISLIQDIGLFGRFLLAVIVSVFIRAIWLSRAGGAKRRFFRAIGIALRMLESGQEQHVENPRWLRFKPHYDGSLVEALNFAGLASRALFALLQQSRRTWQSPPTVAERAVRLSAPLIDIEIVDDLDITHPGVDPTKWILLYGFLYDVAAVVAIRREDLIPAVRSLYSNLPSGPLDAISCKERDVRYLNPAHERSRWELAKDYILPLSSWLSLTVSIIALVIANSK